MKQLLLIMCMLSYVVFSKAQNADVAEVKQVMKTYNQSIEKLDTTGITTLFTQNSVIFEEGSNEGNIERYLNHHLGPELKEFTSFKFNDYIINVVISGEYAFATETYTYDMVFSDNNKHIKSRGVSTSVLQKTKQGWKIWQSHTSYSDIK